MRIADRITIARSRDSTRFRGRSEMIRFATMSFAALLLSSCATAPQVPPAARSELAPTGKLRVGINVQNFLLVNKERVGGEYSGIAVDLGRELGRRLGVPVELVAFETAGKLADAVKAGAKYLRDFSEDARGPGFLPRAIKRPAVRGVSVAAPPP